MTARRRLADPADPRDRDAPTRAAPPIIPGKKPRRPPAHSREALRGNESPAQEYSDLEDEGSARPLPDPEEDGRY